MQEKLKMLDELQAIDLKIDGYRGERELLEGEIAAIESGVEEARSAIALKNEELSLLEGEKARLEEEIATELVNIKRSEAHQKEIKTQKEYQAVSKEISTARKLSGELEDQLLQKIGLIDELRGVIGEEEKNLAAMEENVSSRKGEVREKISGLDSDIASVVSAREELIKGIPGSMARRYGLLREQRRGVAVVEARDGSCFGCNMHLPPQLYNSLFRVDDLVTCPHCQRILVLRREA